VVEVPLRSRAVGVLVPSGGLVDVVASQSGCVEDVYVVAGEVVPDDRLLLRISSGDGSTQGQPAAKMRLQSLQSELHLLEKVNLHEKQLATDRW
jgi:multidrug efflux pump subunit AcrA (membrane-fusion protein)